MDGGVMKKTIKTLAIILVLIVSILALVACDGLDFGNGGGNGRCIGGRICEHAVRRIKVAQGQSCR